MAAHWIEDVNRRLEQAQKENATLAGASDQFELFASSPREQLDTLAAKSGLSAENVERLIAEYDGDVLAVLADLKARYA